MICISTDSKGNKDQNDTIEMTGMSLKESSGCLLKPFLSDEVLSGHLNNAPGRNIGNISVIINAGSADTPSSPNYMPGTDKVG